MRKLKHCGYVLFVFAGLMDASSAPGLPTRRFSHPAKMLTKEEFIKKKLAESMPEEVRRQVGDAKKLIEDLAQQYGSNAPAANIPDKKACGPGHVKVPKLNQHEFYRGRGCIPSGNGHRVIDIFGLGRCCNGREICLGTCGTTQMYCEEEFEKCMQKVCERPKVGLPKRCQEQIRTFTSVTKVFGLKLHQDWQAERCDCANSAEDVIKRHRKYVRKIYRLFNGTVDPDLVEAELRFWVGREAELFLRLAYKFGHMFIPFDDGVPQELPELEEAALTVGRSEPVRIQNQHLELGNSHDDAERASRDRSEL